MIIYWLNVENFKIKKLKRQIRIFTISHLHVQSYTLMRMEMKIIHLHLKCIYFKYTLHLHDVYVKNHNKHNITPTP
jgi:hypothetical protein